MAGGASLLGNSVVKSRETGYSIEIAVAEELAEGSAEETGSRYYPAEVMESFARKSLESLLPARLNQSTEIFISDQEPFIEAETSVEALEKWINKSDSYRDSQLLITDEKYPDVGAAEINGPFEPSCAVVGEGYDFLRLDESDWRNKVLVSEYLPEDFSRETNYDPFKTVVAGIHEIGHTLGLEHSDGEIYRVEDGLTLSAMAASYLDQHTDTGDVRVWDRIYWSPEFSSDAEEIVEDLI